MVQPEKAGPYLLDMWIVLAIQLIPCRNENGLHCLGRQVLLLLGCSLIPVCWFLRRGRIGWSALPTPFPARGRDRPPVEVLAPSGSDPSSDTVMTLLSSLSEEMPEPTCGFLARSPLRPAAFLFWKGNCTSIFCREAGYPPRPLRQVMGTADCQFLRLLSCRRYGGSPGLGFSKKGS